MDSNDSLDTLIDDAVEWSFETPMFGKCEDCTGVLTLRLPDDNIEGALEHMSSPNVIRYKPGMSEITGTVSMLHDEAKAAGKRVIVEAEKLSRCRCNLRVLCVCMVSLLMFIMLGNKLLA